MYKTHLSLIGLLSALYWTMCPETPLIVTWGGPEVIRSRDDLLVVAFDDSNNPAPVMDWSQQVKSLVKKKLCGNYSYGYKVLDTP